MALSMYMTPQIVGKSHKHSYWVGYWADRWSPAYFIGVVSRGEKKGWYVTLIRLDHSDPLNPANFGGHDDYLQAVRFATSEGAMLLVKRLVEKDDGGGVDLGAGI